MGALCALSVMPMLAAGAQTVPGEGGAQPDPPGDCVILSVAPSPVPAFPTQVTVSGTAPNGVRMVLYADGVPAVPQAPSDVVVQDVTDNTFVLKYTVNQPTNLSVNFTFGTDNGTDNAYTAGCATPGGEVVVRVEVKAAEVKAARAKTAALAFTGSSDTPSYVLIGIAAVVLGAVLVVAARRRSRLS
jgi:LPXTG-motif cell wall-anchored protein